MGGLRAVPVAVMGGGRPFSCDVASMGLKVALKCEK